MKTVLWPSGLVGITVTYLLTLKDMGTAHRHHVTRHSRFVISACTIVGLWLVAYVSEQLVFNQWRHAELVLHF